LIEKYIIDNKACFCLASRFFTASGRDWEVIGSRSTKNTGKPNWEDIIHTLRDVKTGETKDVKMIDIVKRIQSEYPGMTFTPKNRKV
jgi:hypothetical protein